MYLVIIVILGLYIAWLRYALRHAQPAPTASVGLDYGLELLVLNMPVRVEHLYRVYCPDRRVSEDRWVEALVEINRQIFGELPFWRFVPAGTILFVPDCRPRRLPDFLTKDRSPCEREEDKEPDWRDWH